MLIGACCVRFTPFFSFLFFKYIYIYAGSGLAYFEGQDPKAFGHFWHKIAITSDTALFKQYCLRAQGVTVPSALEVMPPVAPTAKVEGGGGRGGKYTILAAAAMHSTAERILDSGLIVTVSPAFFGPMLPLTPCFMLV